MLRNIFAEQDLTLGAPGGSGSQMLLPQPPWPHAEPPLAQVAGLVHGYLGAMIAILQIRKLRFEEVM